LASIEACEADPSLARRLNVDVTAELAREAATLHIPFVAVSTDAVFEGRVGGPHREEDDVAPLTVYARTKAAGERAALEAHPGALVVRVNFSGWSPTARRGLAEFFHSRLAAGVVTTGFTDVTVSTLHVSHLVEAAVGLVARGASGLVHVVSSEATTKYAYGRRLAAAFGFDPELVVAAESADHLAVARGRHLALDTSRAATILGGPLPDQEESMRALRAEHAAGLPSRLAGYAPQDGTVVTHENR
jgi:dTDP-4-dehydrorhamnose reductase